MKFGTTHKALAVIAGMAMSGATSSAHANMRLVALHGVTADGKLITVALTPKPFKATL